MNFQNSVLRIVFTIEQLVKPVLVQSLLGLGEGIIQFLLQVWIGAHRQQFNRRLQVSNLVPELDEGVPFFLQFVIIVNDLLGSLIVIPEVRLGHLLFIFRNAFV